MSNRAGSLAKFEALRLDNKGIKRKIHTQIQGGKVSTIEVTVLHTEDPKQALLDKVGPIPPELVQFSKVLVAIYKAPLVDKTDGGIALPFTMSEYDSEEFHHQGKVGLVVATGPLAYVDDENVKFHGIKNAPGDWVWFRPSDGQPCEVNGVFCRLFVEAHIIGRLPHPDFVW